MALTLTKSAGAGLDLYLADTSAATAGVAFLPAQDTGAPQLQLDTEQAQSGYFACWTHGPLDTAGLAQINAALKAARAAATAENRKAIQFFLAGAAEAGTFVLAQGTVIKEGRLALGDPVEGGLVARAHELALVSCHIELIDSRLTLPPRDPGLRHMLVQRDDMPVEGLGLALAGEMAGAFDGTIIVQPATLDRNEFASSATRRGKLFDDGTGMPPIYMMSRDRRLVVHGGGNRGDQPMAMRIGFDPVDGLDVRRTFFEPAAGEPLLSAFLTTHGHQVVLTPRGAGDGQEEQTAPRFGYVRRRTSERQDGTPSYDHVDLLLEGDFDIALADDDSNTVEAPPASYGVVIGDSQHEYLPVETSEALDDAPPVLSLRRGPGHLLNGLSAARPGVEQMTWAKVGSAGEVVSEARDMRRLVAENGRLKHEPIRLARQGELEIAEAETAAMPEGFVPAFAFRETVEEEDGHLPIAAEAAVERRKLLEVEPSGNDSLDEPTRLTPLGFELTEGSDGRITAITLARTPREPTDDDDSIHANLSIKGPEDGEAVSGEVLNAVIRNQLFMVANRSKDLAHSELDPDFRLEGTLELSKWGFKVDLWAEWESEEQGEAQDEAASKPTRPLVLIKGFEGMSMRELIDKPQLWSGKSYLKSLDGQVGNVAFGQAQFMAAVDRANQSDDPMFRAFKAAIGDPNWNGVMILEVPIAPQVLPAQVKGLLGGIDLSRLRAHHLAVPVRRLDEQAGITLSKPFAAINYTADKEDTVTYEDGLDSGKFGGPRQAPNQSDATNDNGKDAFAMKVRELRVGFNNGEIQSFNCKIDLTIRTFFHDRSVRLVDKDGKATETVTLEGRFTKRVVDGKAIETYDFFTESIIEIVMSDGFPLLSRARVTRIAYGSRSVKDGNDEIVESQFLMNGELEFKDLGDFDFIDIEKLSFNGLSLDMRFKIGGGGGIGLPKFRFNPGALIFDFASAISKAKRGFLGSLPLKFTGFGWLGDLVTLPSLGYFSLNRTGGSGNSAPFFLKFDLDLGSLGAFASRLGNFKMDLGLVFGMDGSDKPFWDLGLKFSGSGGKDLDIGLEGFLEFRCRQYEVVTLKYDPGGGAEPTQYYGFRGLDAKLIVFGKELPPEGEMSIYIYVDPQKLGRAEGVGWLLAGKDLANGDFIDLRLLALGQRVNPFGTLGGGFLTTRKVIDKFGDLVTGIEEEPGSGEFKIPQTITYDPTRGWTIGFNAFIYKFIDLGFVIADPELAGILLDVKLSSGSDESLFSIDILYRKLTDDLGVYSAEIVLPPSLRNWQFGAAGITIPVIGVEVFTDGNWGIDIGYPRDKDFSRAFHLNIVPFVGAGGFYYRRVSGPAARLIPAYGVNLNGGENILYKPVTEIGMGLRIGLGVEVAQGILMAGLSVTIYGYLEGAYGRLHNPQNLPTRARNTYIAIAGSVGVMGELYGYVDFGIIKAGVFVQIYAEYGFLLETDKATDLHFEVGVRVRVRVVIASFKVFGKRIEIAISFSFSSSVRFSRTIGHTENREAYAGAQQILEGPEDVPGLGEALEWKDRMPAPRHWGAAEQKIALEVALQPDLTVVPDGEGPQVHVVYLMAATLNDGDEPAPVELLVQGLAAWAICVSLEDVDPAQLDGLLLSADNLDKLSEKLTESGTGGPDYATITEFLSKGFEGRAGRPDDTDTLDAPAAAILPIPEAIEVGREAGSGPGTIRFADYRFIDQNYRTSLEKIIERFVQAQRKAPNDVLDAGELKSLAAVLTEEWVEMIMRAGIERMAAAAREDGEARAATERLAGLIATRGNRSGGQLRSEAADIAATAGRFFVYGQRLPHPTDAGATIPDWAEEPTRDPDGDVEERFFHAMLRLGGIQFPVGEATKLTIPAATYDGWLTVPEGVDTGGIAAEMLDELRSSAAALDLAGELKPGVLFDNRSRYIGLGMLDTAAVLDETVHGRDRVWMFGSEARAHAARLGDGAPVLVKGGSTGNARELKTLEEAEAGHVIPAIVIDVALRKPAGEDQAASGDVFEIKAIPEPLRNLIDPFALPGDGGNVNAPGITEVRLYKVLPDGHRHVDDSAGHPALLVQSNLSVEAKPGDEMQAEEEERIAPVADRGEALAFVRLLRQAAIVNTGGYHLSYPGAGADLAPLFAPGGDDPANETARLRVVIALEPGDAGAFAHANALLSDGGLGGPALDGNTVLALVAADVRDPRHEPGVVPILVSRTEPADGMARDLAERFSSVGLDVEIQDENGTAIARQHLDQAIATGPDFDTGKEETDKREYRVSIMAGKLAGFDSDETFYGIVGKKAVVGGSWRDIYGNLWGKRFDPVTVGIVYNDRLLGLAGLPYLRTFYWPHNTARTLELAIGRSYAGLAELDTRSEPGGMVHATWIRGTQRQLGQDIAKLRRARRQILDGKVRASLHCTLGAPAALDKAWIASQIGQAEADLHELIETFETGIAQKNRGELRQAISALADAKAGLASVAVTFAAVNTEDFTQFGVALEIARPHPDTEPQLYDGQVLKEARDTENTDPLNSLSEVWVARQDVAPNLRGSNEPAEAGIGHGDAEEHLVALARIAPDHKVASGYGEVAGMTERAIWLIRGNYIDNVTGRGLFDNVKPIAYCLPPLRTEAYSNEFDIDLQGGGTDKKKLIDVDADSYGRKALERIEWLLSAGVTVPMLERAADLDATSGMPASDPQGARHRVRSAIGRLLGAKEALAEELGDRLAVVFGDDLQRAGHIDGQRIERARKAMADMMKRDLASHYKVTGLLAYFDNNAAGVAGDIRVAHGKLQLDAQSEGRVAMRTFNMPLAGDGGPVSNDLLVIYEANSDSTTTGNDHFKPPVSFNLTHIQRAERPDFASGVVSYRSTAWLKLVVPDGETWASIKLGNDDAIAPNVLRILPDMPVLDKEGFQAQPYHDSADPRTNLERARQWVSARDILWEAMPTDRLSTTISYARFGEVETLDAGEDLTARIIRFVLATDPQVQPIKGRDIGAYEWAAAQAERLAARSEVQGEAEAPADAGDHAVFNERMKDGVAWLTVQETELVATELRYGPADGPLLSITGDRDGPSGFGAETGIKRRRLESHGLDILRCTAAETVLGLTRNEKIDGRRLADAFVYRMPTVRSGEAIVPALDRSEQITAGKITFQDGKPTNLATVLGDYLGALLVLPEEAIGGYTTLADIVFEYENGLFNGGKGGVDKPNWREEGGPIIAVHTGLKGPGDDKVATIVAQLGDWLATQPAKKGGKPIGALIADARVFVSGDGQHGNDRRIMRLRRCIFTFE